MALTTAEIVTQLYIGYYDRAPDPEGLSYWIARINAGVSLADVANSFATSPEAVATYPFFAFPELVTAENFLKSVYLNLFGRAIDADGLAYYSDKLASGATPVGQILAEIIGNATTNEGSADQAYLANKVTVGLAWTTAAANTSNFKYDAAAASSANSILDGVDATAASVTAAGSQIDSFFSTIVTGTTFTTKVGIDTIVGTADNDFIKVVAVNETTGVAATTWSAADSIDGGAGKDTLTVDVIGTDNAVLYSTKNVEVININNTDAAAAAASVGGAVVDASKFAGATSITQIGKAAAVTNLAATTTAGFKSVDAAVSVTAADAAASATIALDSFGEGNLVEVLSGAAGTLNGVTVSGTVADSNADKTVANIDLDVTVGKNVETLTVNTAVGSTLTVNNNGTKKVTSVDASSSKGAIEYVAANTVANVKTGEGKDTVSLTFAGTAALAAATLSTGAGADDITVAVTKGASTTNVTATVDAGEGDDKIGVTINAGVVYDIKAGAGDDAVTIGGTVKTTDKLDGGEGTDTVSLAAKAAYVADDYIVFNKVLTNFETLKLTGATVIADLDASKLAAGYTTVDLNAGATIIGVGSQALIANGDLTATASGYKVDADPTKTVYAGTLNITEKASGTVIANAETVNLTVDASKGAVAAILEGDAKDATVTLVQALKADGSAFEGAASVTFDNTATDKALASLTVSGNGTAAVINADTTKLVTVDASALASTTFDGKAAAGLTYSSANTLAETIKLGAGIDDITLNASTFGATDTVEGLNLVLNAAGTALEATSDTINLGGAVFKTFTSTQTDLELLLKDAAASADNNLVFQFGGDTYIYQDSVIPASNLLDSGDTLVKLVGTVDLDALVVALA
ncbi:MAG: DUF4214 domain-containing protein [Agrobacterium sp.]|nr:DUF4214 domain-containing protein [Agrobacterium sp.]